MKYTKVLVFCCFLYFVVSADATWYFYLENDFCGQILYTGDFTPIKSGTDTCHVQDKMGFLYSSSEPLTRGLLLYPWASLREVHQTHPAINIWYVSGIGKVKRLNEEVSE